MGDPRKIRNKFQTPMHPWQKDRLEMESPLVKQYGLKNKKEIWKVGSKLKNYKDNAKSLVALTGAQAEKEKTQLLSKLNSYGILSSGELDDILGLKLEQILDRRLQTIVFKKGLARSVKQARQMITHKQIVVNGKKITAPGHLVKVADEESIQFSPSSKFNNPDHPERVKPETVAPEEKKEVKKEEPAKEKKKTEASKPVKEEPKPVEKKTEEKPTEKKTEEKKSESKEAPAKNKEEPKAEKTEEKETKEEKK